MPFIGSYPAVTDVTGAETVNVVVAGVLNEITTANLALSTVMAEAYRDILGLALVAGTNITVTVNDAANTITIAAPAAGYTDAQVKAVMGANIVAGANTTVTYDAIAGTTTIAATAVSPYTDANARAAIGAAAIGDPGYLTITPNTGAATINWAIDPTFKAKVAALGPGTTVQTNDSVTASASYVTLPGTLANYCSSPSSTAANITGDVDISVYLAPTLWIPAAGQVFWSKLATTANGTYRFGLNTSGNLQFGANIDGLVTSFTATTVTPGGTDGVGMWVRVTRTATTGTCNFYTSSGAPETEPTTWTALQLNRTGTAGSMLSSTAALCVSGINNGATNPFAGKVYRVIEKNGIAGTIAVDFNPTSWSTGTTWTSATAEVWTLNGTAAVTAGASTGVSNTVAEFSLAETDPQTSTPLALHDTMYFFTTFALVNTSGASATYTFKVKINGVDLFLIPVQTLTSVASSVRNGSLALRVDMNGSSGASQTASMEMVIANATTGTGTGSDTAATDFVRVSGNRSVSTLTTFTTVPQIQLRCTMGTAAATISAQRGFTQLVLGKA